MGNDIKGTNLCEDVLVKYGLEGTHFDPENPLTLGRKRFDDVSFETAEHEGLELFVEFLDLYLVVDVVEVEFV